MRVRVISNKAQRANSFEEAIQSINNILNGIPQFHKEFLSKKIDNLTYLKEVLSNAKTDDSVDLNEDRMPSCLDIAAMYCPASVVKILLNYGAKPDFHTVKFATRDSHHQKELKEVLALLRNSGVNLNELHKGHTLLFRAKRKGNQEVAEALEQNDVTMIGCEPVTELILNCKDKIVDAYYSVMGLKPAP